MSRVIFLLVVLSLPFAASAQERVYNATDSGAYAGMHLGYADYSVSDRSIQLSDSVGMATIGGGYRFVHGHLAVEAAYGRTQTVRDQFAGRTYNVDISITSARLVARLPLRATPLHGFSLIGGVGQNQIRERISATIEGQDLSSSFREGRFSIFGGGEFDFSSFNVRAVYEHFDMDSAVDLTAITVGFAVKF